MLKTQIDANINHMPITKEETLIKRVKITVVVAMAVLFALVVVLGVQFAVRISRDNMYTSLQAELQSLEQQLHQTGNDITHFQTDRFREEFALKYLGWGRPGTVIFD